MLHLGNINFETVANKNAADGSKVSAESIGNNMYVCMYVCVCVYIYIYIRIHIYTYTYVYIIIHRYAGGRVEVTQVRRGGAEQGHDLLARQGD